MLFVLIAYLCLTLQAIRWTRCAWAALTPAKVKAAWDRTGILGKSISNESETTAAADHEAATRCALQGALEQSGEGMSVEDVLDADSCVEVQQSQEELRTIEEVERDLQGKSDDEDNVEAVEESTEPVCDQIAAIQKASELQRFVERHSSDLGEGCLLAADHLLNRICRSPLQSGLKQVSLDDYGA